jgi:hypothetical protein
VPGEEIATSSVAHTALAAIDSALAAGKGDDDACAQAAHDAYGWAVHAAAAIRVSGADTVIQLDYRSLRDAADRGELADDSRVPPEFFALEKELQTYQHELPKFLSEEGKFLVIQDSHIAGPWATYEDALQAGYERFGLTPFLVKKIRSADSLLACNTISDSTCPT